MGDIKDYVGIPYKVRGRDRDGLDCYGLLCLFYREQFGIELDGGQQYDGLDSRTVVRLISAARRTGDWLEVSTDRLIFGDAIILRDIGAATHVGIAIDGRRFLHAEEPIGVCIGRLDEPRWKPRVVSAWRHKRALAPALAEAVSVVACPAIGSGEPIACETVEPGLTVRQILERCIPAELHDTAEVWVHGIQVKPSQWDSAWVKRGAHVEIRVYPGGRARKWLGLVLSVAVTAWAGGAGGRMFNRLLGLGARSGIGVGIATAVGMLAVSALIPPPSPTGFDDISGSNKTEAYSIQGTQNRLNKYGAVPVVLGRHRVFPPYAAKPYVELVGNDQYLHCLFAVGYGSLTLSDMKIGDTLLTNFSDVEVQSGTGATSLFPATVEEQSLNIALTNAAGWQTRTLSNDANRAVVDLTFPQGLVKYAGDGSLQASPEIHIRVEARLTSGGAWTNMIGQFVNYVTVSMSATTLDYTHAAWHDLVFTGGNPRRPAVGRIYLWAEDVNMFRYRLVVQRVEITDHGEGYTGTPTVTISSLPAGYSGSYTITPTMTDGIILQAATAEPYRRGIELFDFATKDQYDVRVYRQTVDINDSTIKDDVYWTALRGFDNDEPIDVDYTLTRVALRIKATGQLNGVINSFNLVADSGSSNPADVYLNLLQGEFNDNPVATSQIDTTTISAWHTFCATKGYVFNAVLDNVDTLENRLRAVCAAGRATFAMIDGKYSVIYDDTKAAPVQMFTQRNISSARGVYNYLETPHMLECRFVDEDNNWEYGEVQVYADGYDASTATNIKKMDMFGVTDSDAVWKLGRYHLAVMEYQREQFIFDVDVEYIRCTRGDRVVVFHDVPGIGVGVGRITAIGGTYIELDETMELTAGENYTMTIRKADGTIIDQALDTIVSTGETNQFPVPSVPSGIAVGDLCGIYVTATERFDGVVLRIQPKEDASATITLVPYSDDIYTADSGTIPPYTPPGATDIDVAPPRNLTALEYLYKDSGSVMQGVVLSWEHSNNAMPEYYEAQILRPSSPDWEPVGTSTGTTIRIENTPPGTYSFRVRARDGLFPSAWVTLDDEVLDILDDAPADVTNLQASFRNGKITLSWDSIEDVRGIEFVVRYGDSWDAGTLVSAQAATEYIPGKDGKYWVKARCLVGGAVSDTAAGVTVSGVNVATNVVHSVVEDWSGTVEGACYRPPDYLSRRWFGSDGELPDTDVWDVSGAYSLDTNRIKIPYSGGGANFNSGYLYPDAPLPYRITKVKFEMGIYAASVYTEKIGIYSIGAEDDADTVTVNVFSKDSQYEAKIYGLTGTPTITFANTGSPVTLEIVTRISDKYTEVKVDGVVKASGTAFGSYTTDKQIRVTCSLTAVDAYIYEMQIGMAFENSRPHIRIWSGRTEPGLLVITPFTTGHYYTASSNQLDLGHDDWVIATVSKLRFHGSDDETDLFTIDDLLAEDDLFNSASSKLTVKPQIRVKADGASDWGDWQNMVNMSYYGRYFDVRLEVECEEHITAIITDFEWSLDMEDRIDEGRNVAVAASGTTITYDTPFQSTQRPQVTQTNAAAGDTLVVTNESNTGFTVQILDGSGNGKAGTINWMVKGY